jgi:hypothetical protein
VEDGAIVFHVECEIPIQRPPTKTEAAAGTNDTPANATAAADTTAAGTADTISASGGKGMEMDGAKAESELKADPALQGAASEAKEEATEKTEKEAEPMQIDEGGPTRMTV